MIVDLGALCGLDIERKQTRHFQSKVDYWKDCFFRNYNLMLAFIRSVGIHKAGAALHDRKLPGSCRVSAEAPARCSGHVLHLLHTSALPPSLGSRPPSPPHSGWTCESLWLGSRSLAVHLFVLLGNPTWCVFLQGESRLPKWKRCSCEREGLGQTDRNGA